MFIDPYIIVQIVQK